MAATVTVEIIGGPSATVDWSEGMTALQALELAQAKIEPDPNEQLTFGLQYYGAALGYLVNMINETYDSFISRGGEKATPFYYWSFHVNGQPASMSVDRTTLAANDKVQFDFVRFDPVSHGRTLLSAKHKHQLP
jgi:hypothetical protein